MRRALAFLTPLGGAAAPSAAAVSWFPAVGALIGLAVGGVWWAAAEIWPPAVAAALALAVDLALTGLLHVDGLADAADGLLPPLARERRLEVMADPAVGAFGVATVVVVLLARWAAMASQRATVLLPAGLWCASRTVMAVVVRQVTYARPGGLAAAFVGNGQVSRGRGGLAVTVGGMALAGMLVTLARRWPGLAALTALVAAAAAVIVLAVRRVGGFTGDVLGAAGVVGETAGLVVAAAKW